MSADKHVKTSKADGTDWTAKIWNLLTSLKLVIILLLILSAFSIAGTVIEQNKPLQEYYLIYQPGTVALFLKLGLFDMYHSWWFVACLSLLALNITACTIDRCRGIMDGMRKKNVILDEKLSQFLQNITTIRYTLPPDVLEKKMLERTGKEFPGKPLIAVMEDGVSHYFFEKGKYSRLAFFMIHLSILIVFLGAVSGSFLGYKGYVNIFEGESISQLETNAGEIKPFNFQVKCNAFHAEFYPSGAPMDYRSDLSIVQKGKEVIRKIIRVNDPLTFEGVTFYQSSYGELPDQELKMKKYTGLQVNNDPGEILVWLGSMLLIAGIMTAFFLSHKKIWISLRTGKKGESELKIAGTANKNRDAFAGEMEQIIQKLKEIS